MEIIRGKRRVEIPLTVPVEAEEYYHKPLEKIVATFDTETDPFEPGLVVEPFTCGFYIPSIEFYKDFWGMDCIDQFFYWLKQETGPDGMFENWEFCIFVHNGGNFDFYFCLDHFDDNQSPFIINGRLVSVKIGGQEFRDSYSMIPVALGNYEKIEIDYNKMKRECREQHKDEILFYQKGDCVSLSDLVVSWLDMFGSKLTMASAALPMLRSFHGFDVLRERVDKEMRPYYFGGRNQCFETGIIEGNFKVYDINSSYPDSMKRVHHPVSDFPRYEDKITDKTHFAHIRAFSDGALPIRGDKGELSFPVGVFDFFACIHEINAGLETGTLRIYKVYSTIYFDEYSKFDEFIDTFYKLRLEAKASDDKIRTLFYKLVMNSSYGKFAQDPRKYEHYLFNPDEIPEPYFCGNCYNDLMKDQPASECPNCNAGTHSPWGWYLHTQNAGISIYAAPQKLRPRSFFNVATAASITSAARASLLRGIRASERPIYCDTDSVICLHMNERYGVTLDDKKLGAWGTEAQGDKVCIAGKKLYAIFSNGELVKKASKGVRLEGSEIERICNGETIEYANPVPKFKLDGSADFVVRKISRTT